METGTVVEVDAKSELRKFSPSDAAIARMAEQYMPLTIRGVNDAAGFKQVHEARMVVKAHRVEVEKTRKALKADALEYGRRVDSEAKRLAGLLEPIEAHLEAEEKRIQDEKDRIKNAARLKAEAEARAKEEAEAARLKAEQEAEAERLRVEREKIDAERRAMEEQRRKLDAEARKIEAEQQRLAKIEDDGRRAIELEKVKAEAAERAKRETEERLAREAAQDKAKVEAVEAARRRTEELKPDRVKLFAVAEELRRMKIPSVSADASEAAEKICRVIRNAAADIEDIAASVGAVDGDSLF